MVGTSVKEGYKLGVDIYIDDLEEVTKMEKGIRAVVVLSKAMVIEGKLITRDVYGSLLGEVRAKEREVILDGELIQNVFYLKVNDDKRIHNAPPILKKMDTRIKLAEVCAAVERVEKLKEYGVISNKKYIVDIDELKVEANKYSYVVEYELVWDSELTQNVLNEEIVVEQQLKDLEQQCMILSKKKNHLEFLIKFTNAPEEVEFKYEETILLENGFEAERIYLFFRDLRYTRRYHTFREDLIKISNHLYNKDELTKVLKELRIRSYDIASYIVLAGEIDEMDKHKRKVTRKSK